MDNKLEWFVWFVVKNSSSSFTQKSRPSYEGRLYYC